MKTIFILGLFLFSGAAFAEKAAKVMFVRGVAVADGKRLKKGDWVEKRAVVVTKNRSVIRLLFLDKSTITLGPNSHMRIDNFRKGKSSVMALWEGKIRAKIIKNAFDKRRGKSKLIIETNVAVMGVRGTDFRVDHRRDKTDLTVFKGEVRFMKRRHTRHFNRREIDRQLDERGVSVRKGQFSRVSKRERKATRPVILRKSEIKKLKRVEVKEVKIDIKERPEVEPREVIQKEIKRRPAVEELEQLNKQERQAEKIEKREEKRRKKEEIRQKKQDEKRKEQKRLEEQRQREQERQRQLEQERRRQDEEERQRQLEEQRQRDEERRRQEEEQIDRCHEGGCDGISEEQRREEERQRNIDQCQRTPNLEFCREQGLGQSEDEVNHQDGGIQ